jgi:hypothetical protein
LSALVLTDFIWLVVCGHVVCGHKDPFSIKRAAQATLEGHPHHKSVPGSTELLETLSDKVQDPGGQQPDLRSVSLPASRVRVTVILPRFSEPGLYLVAVSRDQAGGELDLRERSCWLLFPLRDAGTGSNLVLLSSSDQVIT